MQRYGMLLADGGSIALTAQSDRFTAHKWAGLLGSYRRELGWGKNRRPTADRDESFRVLAALSGPAPQPLR